MIKRYVLDFEFHWGYWPKLSIKRVPRPGDWVFDGGEWGQLGVCRECGGDGLLHLVTPKQYMQAKPESLFPRSNDEPGFARDFDEKVEEEIRSPETIRLALKHSLSTYRVGEKLWTHHNRYVVTQVVNGDYMILTREDKLRS